MARGSITRKFAQNFSSLLTAKALGDLFTFFFFMAIARTYGQEGIGKYSFAMALTGFVAILAEFGLANLSIKEMSRLGDSLREYFGNVIALRVALSIAVLGLLSASIPFLPFPPDTRLIIVIIGSYQIFSLLIDGIAAIFLAREEMHFAALIEVSFRMATAALGIALIEAGADLNTAVLVLPAVSLAFVAIAFVGASRRYGWPRFSLSVSTAASMLREAVPYALSILLRRLSTRVDVIFLGFLIGASAAGVYNVGFRVVFMLYIVPRFVGMTLLPLASRLHRTSGEELARLYHDALRLACLLGVPAAVGLALISPELIGLVFGPDFRESVIILQSLSALVWMLFLSSIMGSFLIATDRQGDLVRGQWINAAINIVGNALLIPTVGIMGAAFATLVSEAVLVLLWASKLKASYGWPRIFSRVLISGFGALVFVGVAKFCEIRAIAAVIPLAIAIYGAVLLSFGEIRRNEFQTLRAMVAGEPRD